MTQQKGNVKSPEILQNQFRTPKRPSSPSTNAHSTSTKRKITASPAVRTPATALKRNTLPPTRAQSTLTQIDFVAQPTHRDDDQLDYIAEGHPGATHQRQESDQLDNGSESETDYRPPTRTRASLTKFETNDDHPKRRRKGSGKGNRIVERGRSLGRSHTPRTSKTGKGKGKSGEKPATKRDKTLTQMNFVRRYITIDDSDDNDVNMGYIQQPSQKLAAEQDLTRKEEHTPIPDRKIAKLEPATCSKRNRGIFEQELDLSTGEPHTSGETQNISVQAEADHQNYPNSGPPFTPQKCRKLEIPSSQSPESPGLAIITSSQFRCATHSPAKRKPLNLRLQAESLIKEELPEDTSQLKIPTRNLLTRAEPADQGRPTSADGAQPEIPYMDSLSQEPPPNEESNPPRSQRERTVVYETDAESSSDGFDGMEDEVTTSTRALKSRESVSHLVDHSPDLPSDDSQELPLPDTQPPIDMGFDLPSEPPMSDASAYYQRVQPATQFPHEPVPNLNTQKLSELFPNEGSTQYPQQQCARSSRKFPGPFLQSQTQSQELDQTEIVPESSPVREQQNSADEADSVFQRPRAPNSVVQVESSQPVSRVEPRPGNILSRSQLLTSSVMESIALPTFWTGSQDSVGEPYSLPDH